MTLTYTRAARYFFYVAVAMAVYGLVLCVLKGVQYAAMAKHEVVIVGERVYDATDRVGIERVRPREDYKDLPLDTQIALGFFRRAFDTITYLVAVVGLVNVQLMWSLRKIPAEFQAAVRVSFGFGGGVVFVVCGVVFTTAYFVSISSHPIKDIAGTFFCTPRFPTVRGLQLAEGVGNLFVIFASATTVAWYWRFARFYERLLADEPRSTAESYLPAASVMLNPYFVLAPLALYLVLMWLASDGWRPYHVPNDGSGADVAMVIRPRVPTRRLLGGAYILPYLVLLSRLYLSHAKGLTVRIILPVWQDVIKISKLEWVKLIPLPVYALSNVQEVPPPAGETPPKVDGGASPTGGGGQADGPKAGEGDKPERPAKKGNAKRRR